MKTSITIICLSLLLTSCRTYNYFEDSKEDKEALLAQLDSSFHYNPDYQYTVRVNDKINISVWGQKDISVGSVYDIYNSNQAYGKWLLVDAEGNIEVPKIGTTRVEGKTIIEIKTLIKNQLKEWIINPIIDVKVLNKEITILGEVRNPGVFPIYKDCSNILEIIARAGGMESYANIQYIKVLRQEGEHVRVAAVDLSQAGNYINRNLSLIPGDVVIIPSKSYKEFDKRVSTIIPFATTATAASILMNTLSN